MALAQIHYKGHIFSISYILQNLNITNPHYVFVFLHGWGSNKELMQLSFSQSFNDCVHIYLDLPGFGASSSDISLFTHDYANIVELFLAYICMRNPQLDSQHFVMVGHSFGGKVAVLLAGTYLVLLSSAGIVVKKSLKVRCKIAFAKLCKKFGFGNSFLRAKDTKGLNEVMYQTFKNVVDEDFSESFKQCRAHTLVCWGVQDRDTPLSSGEMIASLLPHSYFATFLGDHYFFLRQAHKVEEFWYKMLANIKKE